MVESEQQELEVLPAGTKLDIRIALSVMGWPVLTAEALSGYPTWQRNPSNYPHVIEPEEGAVLLLHSIPDEGGYPFRPSTHLMDAFQAVDELRRQGWQFQMDDLGFEGEEWRVVFWRHTDAHGDHARQMADGPTREVAICRGALMAADWRPTHDE